jgi:pilus assembly protein FimV
MLRKLALIVAIGPAMWFSAAHALGLGEIEVDSRLNQRFSAVIPLTSVSVEEAENLLVRLADNEDFAKAGIDRADYLSSLVFEVVNDKSPHIVVSSKQLAREPFISFLLDVRSANGRVLREYTVLLDPPAYAQAAPAKPVAVPATSSSAPSDFYQTAEESAQSQPPPAPPAPPTLPPQALPPAAPASAPVQDTMAPAAANASSYGPVRAKETLWSIASKLRPDAKISMDQMLWAIYSNNQGSFDGHHIQGLRKGSVLKVPAAGDIAAVSPAAAKAHLQQLRGHRAAAKPRKPAVAPTEATLTPVVPAPKGEPLPSVKPALKPETKPRVIPAAPPATEKKTLEAVAPPAKPVVAPAPAPAPPPSLPPPAPAAAPPVSAAPVASTTTTAPPGDAGAAATQSALPSEPAATATPAAVPVEQQPAAPITPIPEPLPQHNSSLLDDWLMPAVAGVMVLLLALLGVRYWQKRQAGKSDEPALTPKATKNLQFWKTAAEASPAPAPTRAPPAAPPVITSAKTGKFAAAVAAASAAAPPAAPKFPDPLAQTVIEKKPGLSVTQTLTQTLTQSDAPHFDETSQLPNFDSTQVFGGHAEADALTSTLGTDTVDFDITGKFEAETLKVDLDTNDPVSEADFHLAYGLYDEAALLLESAAEKNPGRTDIRVKLAETYFRASKPHEFEEVAQSLKPQLDAAEWQKIAIMGSQLSPNSPLFAGAATAAALSESVDLAFDEPAPAPQAVAPARTVSPTATIPPSRSNSAVLDFKLEDLEAPRAAPPAPAKSEPRVSTGNTLEFNLSEFDLGKAEAAAAPAASEDNALEFDLSGFDEEPAATVAAATAVTPPEDIRLEDFDLGELPTDSHAISTGDEAGTKLDLARAYVDMGDNDMARSLLNEVLAQGSNDQKKEAQTLIQRLV